MAQSKVAPSDQADATDRDNCKVALSCSNSCSVDTLPMSTWSISPCMDRLRAAPVQSWKEEIHSRLRVMAARSQKYFCSVPSRAPPTWDREISVKPISTTGESHGNRKPVEESSNGEYMASLKRGTETNWCDLHPGAEFLKVIDHFLRKRKSRLGHSIL